MSENHHGQSVPRRSTAQTYLFGGFPLISVTDPDHLLAHAAAGYQSSCDADVVAEAAELVEVEQARVRLLDRLLVTTGRVGISVAGLPVIYGVVVDVGADLIVTSGAGEQVWALRSAAVIAVSGLAVGLRNESSGPVIPELTWPRYLRQLAGSEVRVHSRDGVIHVGQLAGVGADFFDLILSGAGLTSRVSTIALNGVIAVQTLG
ncbi:MAG: hypothetical protein F2797_01600 [Actinobacteria bacterium]|nr:hypothetical protein [Actinomycetota bacterium]